MRAESSMESIAFAVACDGMGGLQKGELASAEMIFAFEKWFDERICHYLTNGFDGLFEEWDALIQATGKRIYDYGRKEEIRLGTTVSAFLAVGDRYFMAHVGDTRIYQISDSLYLLTHDHTFVQQEIDANRMTEEEAKTHPKRNALLQCVGASQTVVPDFGSGELSGNESILLCSDGFRHTLTLQELYEWFYPNSNLSHEERQAALFSAINTNKERKESDNISAILLYCFQEQKTRRNDDAFSVLERNVITHTSEYLDEETTEVL